MILASPRSRGSASGITLDHLLAYAAAQRGDDIALIDPPNRAAFTAGVPRALTYAQADRAVTAIAARLCRLGLQPDHVIGLQLPNTVEAVLAFLGVLRAGLIASPLPLLWRHADCAAATALVGAQGLIAAARIGATDHGALAMDAAAKVFTVRHVCLFGARRDGTVSLDDIFEDTAPSWERPIRGADAAAHVAALTWDVDAAGARPVARSHLELMAAGFEVMLEAPLAARGVILSSLCLGSLAGIATTLATWLLTRGTLVLHHPFDPAIMRRQILDHGCSAVIVPASLAVRCAEAGMFRGSAVGTLAAVWRAPERMATCPAWPGGDRSLPALMDVTVFGETGLFAALRGDDGKPAGIRPGAAPRRGNPLLIEAARTRSGTVVVRGPMVPRRPFPHAGAAGPDPRRDPDGFLDTSYPCRIAADAGTLAITGPPASIVGVGGYRFTLARLQEAVARIDPAAMIAAFPDALTGQRIAGMATRRDALAEALAAGGHNPLVAGAFRPRRSADSRNAA